MASTYQLEPLSPQPKTPLHGSHHQAISHSAFANYRTKTTSSYSAYGTIIYPTRPSFGTPITIHRLRLRPVKSRPDFRPRTCADRSSRERAVDIGQRCWRCLQRCHDRPRQFSASKTLWQSFEYTTDTILPSQVIDRGGILPSRRSETNFSRGRLQRRLQQDGNLVLNTINLPTDYANEPYYQTTGTQLVFNESGHMYVVRDDGEKFNLTKEKLVSAKDYYLRATLSFDGVFTQYFHPKSFTADNVSWSSLGTIPEDICISMSVTQAVGVCGYNSICFLREDKRPRCECSRGYSLLDPNDSYGSCKPDFIQGCREDELSNGKDLYDVVELKNAGWQPSNYMHLYPSTGEMCKQSCLEDCLCAVAVIRDEYCWKKKLPLSNGRVDDSRPSLAFIKIRKNNFSTLPQSKVNFCTFSQSPVLVVKKKDKDDLNLAGSIMLGSSVFVNFLLVGVLCLGFLSIYKGKHEEFPKKASDMNLRCFTYKELEEATDGFSEELGKGTFGTVYKGKGSEEIEMGCTGW